MQVTINVSRTVGAVMLAFSATATSVEEAIKIANQLTEMKESDLPAASTDAAVNEKHNVGTVADTSAADKKAADAAKKKADAEAKKSADAAASKPTAEAKTDQQDTAGSPSETAQRTYEEVRQKILSISKDKGREPTVAALARFGVTAGKDLKAEQYNEAYDYFADVISGKIDPLKGDLPVEEFA